MSSAQKHLKQLIDQTLQRTEHDLPAALSSAVARGFSHFIESVEHQQQRKRWLVSISSEAALSLEDKTLLEEMLLCQDSPVQQWLSRTESQLALRYLRQQQSPRHTAAALHGPAPQTRTSAYEQSRQRPLKDIGNVYCVASGKGGVGKSSVAAYLAVLLARQQLKVGLLDADIHGPSAPALLGLSEDLSVGEGQKVVPVEGRGVRCVSFGFLSDPYHPVVWRGPLISKALEQFLFDVHWGALDYLIIDLPPGTGDIPMTLASSITLDGVVVVTTSHEIALLDAHKAISMFKGLHVPVLGLIGNMLTFRCPHCNGSAEVFGDVQQLEDLCGERNLPLLARLPLLPPTSAGEPLGDEVLMEALQPAVESLRKPDMEHLHSRSMP